MARIKRRFQIPEPFGVLVSKKARYKVFYGGRGGAKSWAFARVLLAIAAQRKVRILCARELQVSIADSVHKLLCDQIHDMGFDAEFVITKTGILGVRHGSEFLFKGLRHNVSEIKSLEGVDYCWVEEAHSVSRESWELLIPTIRKEGSEIWISFNPARPDDETYRRFVLSPPGDALVVKVGWEDNPWFPATLNKERLYCLKTAPEDYRHIWGGEPRILTEAQVFKGKYIVEPFETPDGVRFFHGVDWGFACLGGGTLVATDKGDVPIKDIKQGDMVLTRDGYKKVLFTQSRGYKTVYGVDCGYKKRIIATGDHRIFTADGWKTVAELDGEESLCMMKSSLMGKFINAIRTGNIRIIFIGSMDAKVNLKSCIERYGKRIMARSQKVVTSIMLMGTRLITALKILYASPKANIKNFIILTSLEAYRKRKCRGIESFTDILKKIGQKGVRSLCKLPRRGMEFVKNAGNRLSLPTFIKNFVVRNVGNVQTQETAKQNIHANGAEKSLWRRLMGDQEKLVLQNVPIKLSLLPEKEEVFDITVENGEYFANGVLVHNCDPTALVRCWIQDNRLYVDAEAYGVGVELDELPQLFDSIPTARTWPIKADSARPETISYMRRKGYKISAAKKWAGSIEDGIACLKGFEKIVIHPRCKHTIEEFGLYSYKVDKNNGDILPIIVDAWNHCVSEGSLITTARGEIPIQQVCVGDKVLTREGYKKVLFAGVTGINRQIIKIKAQSHILSCTPEHIVYTTNRGFIRADMLKHGDTLLCVQNSLHTMDMYGDGTQIRRKEVTEFIINGQEKKAVQSGCIVTCGKRIMALFLKATTSIIKMVTQIITRWITLNAFRQASTSTSIRSAMNERNGRGNILQESARLQKLGILLKKVTESIRKSVGLRIRILSQKKKSALTVDKSSCLMRSGTGISSAPINANQHGGEKTGETMLNVFANGAERRSGIINIASQKLVGIPVEIVFIGHEKEARVYDLTVEGQHEFFANGILVHNCIDGLRYSLDGYIHGKGPLNISNDIFKGMR